MSGFNHYRRREARAVNSANLKWSDLGHTDIDIVAARALSGDKLGALLESLKWAGDHRAYGGAVELLGERFHKRTRRRPLKALLHTAVHEWVNESCRECSGRAISVNRRTCIVCNGTGLHVYGDRERAHMANIKAGAWVKHERDYQAVVDCLSGAVAAHRAGVVKALG
jgi:hypothetical protein